MKQRNCSLDLLRIISMMMVVMLHYLGSGKLMESVSGVWTPNWFIVQLIGATHWVCVNCFVLISGHFLCTSRFRLDKWVQIWVEAFFYSIVLYLILVALGAEPFSLSQLVKNGMNVTLRRYWFVTIYLLLYALFPVLNMAIQGMSQKAHLSCCTVMLFFFCVLSNIIYICDFANVEDGFSLVWFCTLYMIAAYTRKYVPKGTISRRWAIFVYIGCSLVLVVARCIACWVTPIVFGKITLTHLFHTYNSIPVAIGSIALFLSFRDTRVQGKLLNKFIVWAAPVSFSVYLLHHHPTFKEHLWKWLDAPRYDSSVWMLLRAIVVVLVIFVVSCAIEYARCWLFRICGIDRIIQQICDRAEQKVDTMLNRMTYQRTQ